MRLIWIRHGETDWNTKRCYLGHLDVPLNQKGRLQVQQTGQLLKKMLYETKQMYQTLQIYTSDLSRCKETAAIVCKELFARNDPVPSASLRELNFGDWDGHTYDDIYSQDPNSLEKWYADPFAEAPPNGETLTQLGLRLDCFLENLINRSDPDATILLVSHGGTIRWFQCSWILQDKSQFWQVQQIPNGGMLVADWDQSANTWSTKAVSVEANL